MLSDLVGRLISYGTQAMAAEGVTADVVAQAAGMVGGYASPIAALEAKAHESANADRTSEPREPAQHDGGVHGPERGVLAVAGKQKL